LAVPSLAQQVEEDFRAYTDAPRLLLRPQRLRLLKRERERQSMRWQQFDLLVSGKAPMPEPGLAFALYSQVTGRADSCRHAEAGVGRDVRQMALVYDWCQSAGLATPLRQAAEKLVGQNGVSASRDRVFAALALRDTDPEWSEATMKDVIEKWWRGFMVPKLRRGEALPREDIYPLFEILHAVRDNLNIDLRDPVQGFFRDLPVLHLLSYYPAAYPGPENEYRIPYYQQDGEPDLRKATLSRAAEMAMIAFDSNSQAAQAMQSWTLQDRFIMKGTLGAVYEFLWANPYQPGITFHVLPNVFHDARSGRLFIRSSWEEDATFFCYDNGIGQIFTAGKRADVRVSADTDPIRIANATVMVGQEPVVFETGHSLDQPLEPGERRPPETWFIVGLKKDSPYHVEPDDEEMFEVRSDAGGIVFLQWENPRLMTVRIHEPRAVGTED
jgi:hypothetical protein